MGKEKTETKKAKNKASESLVFCWNKNLLSKALNQDIKADVIARGVSTDSRTIEKSQIFVALNGENFDGSKFVAEALKKGASLVITENAEFANRENVFVVKDALRSLQKMASVVRQNHKAKIFAITGSVGKTTAKELCATVLATKYKTYATKGNLNNHIGVPLTLCNIPEDCERAVIEMGMNHAGEISDLSRIASPDFCAITNVAENHIENFGSMAEIALAKAEIMQWMKIDGKALLPADSPFYDMLCVEAEDNGVTDIISFGIKANNVRIENEKMLSAYFQDERINFAKELGDRFVIENILLALTVAKMFDLEMTSCVSAIAKMPALKGRGEIFAHKSGAEIIDDSYNAGPKSMQKALHLLTSKNAKRKIAMLGDMRELGDKSEELHLGLLPCLEGVDVLVTSGNFMKKLNEKSDIKNKHHFDDVEKAAEFLDNELKKQDLLLCKGSNGSKIWKVVEKLKAD